MLSKLAFKDSADNDDVKFGLLCKFLKGNILQRKAREDTNRSANLPSQQMANLTRAVNKTQTTDEENNNDTNNQQSPKQVYTQVTLKTEARSIDTRSNER